MLRIIRITLAAVMMIGITWLFVDFTGTAHHLVGGFAKLQLVEALLAGSFIVVAFLTILTLLCGRIYCSIICPLGIMMDLFGWLGKKAKKNRYTFSKEMKWLRYPLLVVFLVAHMAGLAVVVQLLAPYSTFGLIATNLLQPVYQAGNNVLAYFAEQADSYAFYHSEVWLRSVASLVIAIVMLMVIAVLAWRNGRTWCNTICPAGTLLSLLSRFSFLKINFDTEKCRNCSLCSKNCKAACIDYKTHTVDASRCVVCGDCIKSCKFGALKYDYAHLHTKRTGQTGETSGNSPENEGRRAFLLSSALLATAAMAQKKDKIMDGGLAEIEDKVAPERQIKLTPPGSLSAQNMAQKCTGCQLCISECPNQVLRPSDDWLHLMQPVMSYERGYCRPECNRCSEVCPAGAIRPLKHEDKASTQIGHAVWIKKNCIPLTDGMECGNCARHCPVGAIEMVPSDPDDEESPYVPAVNEARCIGCGACEYLCPARPFSAIYVEGHEVHKEI
ncbi:MAG: 4Fe-4S dicluster domain-containing protein [Prevotella sp.]|jgi:polyferredoxin|nr:4Fe-4S dicluster domain-containing protein [Prevotella sp.]